MTNLFVYLIGPPGVGKYTIGKILAERLPAKLVDNHHWNNPIFALLEQDGMTPLPQAAWDRTHLVRTAVLETIATLSPKHWNFVFTHAAATTDPIDRIIAGQILSAAVRRSAGVLAVRLGCAPDELARRVAMPERALRLKERDPVAARRNAAVPLFDPGCPDMITLDTTALPPEAVAAEILERLKRLPRS
ncbi:MAG: hypothetical protein HYR63_18225 [Proteobacteria bacterium]|nr:hypothetical protein [Pseudomonadota bacterium]MBI3499526.1 hypothetical protein [Pseudomonadota bacterium]